jgi:hypothetical protein
MNIARIVVLTNDNVPYSQSSHPEGKSVTKPTGGIGALVKQEILGSAKVN